MAPPAHIDAPPYDFEKKTRKRDMKKGLESACRYSESSSPVAVNHKGEKAGKR